jgi:hypothetical protein
MVLQKEQSPKAVQAVILLTDISAYPQTYNEFEITEGDLADFLLKLTGDYRYKVYQMPTNIDTDWENNGIFVELGKARLIAENDIEIPTYNGSQTAKIYGQ